MKTEKFPPPPLPNIASRPLEAPADAIKGKMALSGMPDNSWLVAFVRLPLLLC
jgi:hypothetical protein